MKEGTITSIEVQKKNPERVNVYIDGDFCMGLSRITAAWLETGQKISKDNILDLKNADLQERAFQHCLSYLKFRPRSTCEVKRHLRKKGYDESVIDLSMCKLQETGWLNDREFARSWIENRATFRPRSKHLLRMELKAKGLNPEIIETELDDVDEYEMANAAAKSKFNQYNKLDWKGYQNKMYSFLSRRGFNYEIIKEIVVHMWNEREESKNSITR
jgi:regulatory protein